MMAKVDYRILSLAQRGLLYSMRLECWVNHSLPEYPSTLATVLGFSVEEIKVALPAVMPFFVAVDGKIVSPELDDYRAHLDGIKDKQSKGGKLGAGLTNGKRKPRKAQNNSGDSTTNPTTNSRLTRSSTRDSLVQLNPVQNSQKQSLVGDELSPHDEWLGDYARASNGG